MAHILLIEPNHILAAQYRRCLEKAGHRVDWCHSAQTAVNKADKRRPDAIVMELLLAAHSGIEFLYEFRSYSEWRKVPVVILTRLPRADAPASEQALRNLGVTAYLYKPETSLKKLVVQLDRLLVNTKI